MDYEPQKIEKKWQEFWSKNKTFSAIDDSKKEKFYVLDMFPYPSGAGLHVGHPRGYTATDFVAKMKLMQGYNVLHPMGWDAFGLPAENYAIKNKTHPKEITDQNIKHFKEQLSSIGLGYDWDREINTTDPDYYKWTQWIFLQLYKKGLAYESELPINFCPSCKTGLANEEVKDGLCDRCGTKVVRKKIRQWVLKITDYADRLLKDLDTLDWPEPIKEMQRNWIGRSEGTTIKFPIKTKKPTILIVHGFTGHSKENWFPWFKETFEKQGFNVLIPDLPNTNKPKINEWLNALEDATKNIEDDLIIIGHSLGAVASAKFAEETDKKVSKLILVAPTGPIEKEWEGLLKVGFDKDDIEILNEFNKTKIDFKKIKSKVGDCLVYLSSNDPYIPASIVGDYKDLDAQIKTFENKGHFNTDAGIISFPEIENDIIDQINVFTTRVDTLFGCTYVVLAPENNLIKNLKSQISNWDEVEEYIVKAQNKSDLTRIEQKEKTGVKLKGIVAINPVNNTEIPVFVADYVLGDYATGAIMCVPAHDERDFEFAKKFGLPIIEVVSRGKKSQGELKESFIEKGYLINSDQFNGLKSEEAAKEIIRWLKEKNLADFTVSYKLRDWIFSRQRYWGEPIPIVHCEKCGIVPLSDKDLPLELPYVDKYEPTGTGESPLAQIKDWVNTTCPKCGSPAKRETNTMPQWAGSCWYYLRYLDPKNKQELVGKEKEKYFMPVDLYVGGAEHAVLHLLYARFWHKVLYDIKAVSTLEPFQKLVNVGIILAPDGKKMSKSLGNVINPDELINEFGTDSFRLYEGFIGPFRDRLAWDPQGIVGTRRFLDRVWKLLQKEDRENDNPEIERKINQLAKKVAEDIINFDFNTAIAALMEFVNFTNAVGLSKSEKEILIKLLAPFAPHLAEEIWLVWGNKNSIFESSWPKFDEKATQEQEITLVVQVNGKTRASIKIEAGANQEIAESAVKKDSRLSQYLKNSQKIIFVQTKEKPIAIINLIQK